ncbi:MAG: PhoU domain-containing protein [Candidatus Pacearchaeota archaeon]
MEQKNVKELITKIKDLSVLAVDLAYCSVLFSDKDLAKEVSSISRKIDDLRDNIEKSTLKAATSGVNEEKLIGILRLASYSERISNIAEELAKTVLKGQVHEIEKKSLNEAEENFVRIKIKRIDSNKNVSQFGKDNKIWIVTIKRKKTWIHHPKAEENLLAGDLVYGVRQ